MRFCSRFAAAAICVAALCSTASSQRGGAQLPPDSQVQQAPAEDAKLPNGKSQRDEILKAEHKQNLKDAADLVALSQQLQQEFEKNDSFVFSLNTLKKTDDIEKLAKKIRSRMLHN